jgi:hypothetical protein
MRGWWVLMLATACCVCGAAQPVADPASDAPETLRSPVAAFKDATSYAQALQAWQSPEDVNAWIGARFEYDMARAMQLSETQRRRSGSLPIHEPQAFFAAPSGVCVDLSRFAVEAMRQIDPEAAARYLMIEFAPLQLNGQTLRLHWLATFQRDGQLYFFADSKRPGVIAGPYASTRLFIDDYAVYRGRPIVAFRELESYQRQPRALAAKTLRAETP